MCNILVLFFTELMCSACFMLKNRFSIVSEIIAFVPKVFVLTQYGAVKVFRGMDLTILFIDLSTYSLYVYL